METRWVVIVCRDERSACYLVGDWYRDTTDYHEANRAFQDVPKSVSERVLLVRLDADKPGEVLAKRS